MMINAKQKIAALVVLVCLTVALAGKQPTIAAAPEQCIRDWTEAAAIVQSQKMIDVAGLSRLAPDQFNGQIMTARLCRADNTYFYRLVIRRSDGRMQHIKVNPFDASKQ